MFSRMYAPPDPTALFAAAMKALGLTAETNQKKIVRALEERYPGRSVEQSSVSRWKRGGGFSYENTMVLLKTAGWLNDQAIVEAERDAARAEARQGKAAASGLADDESRAQDGRRRGSAS